MTLQAADPRSLFYRKSVALIDQSGGYTEAELDRLFAGDPDRISVPPFSPVPKPTRIEDPAWLGEVRAMPCCVCEHMGVGPLIRIHNGPVEPNHTETVGSGGGDDSAAPMCHYHHQQWHLRGRATMARAWGIDPRAVAAELWAEKCARAF